MDVPPPCPCVHWLVHNGCCCECNSAVDWYKSRPKNSRRIKDPDCDHSMSHRGDCSRCWLKVDEKDGEFFNYITQGKHLSYKFVASMKWQKFGIGCGQRKLHLVVDLQHVLLDSHTHPSDHLMNQVDSRDDGVFVKLRPFAREFLREVNDLFTVYAYTKSDPKQARNFIKLLDPFNIFFPSRFITLADETRENKSLDFVLAEERGVVILDCKPDTWDNDDKRNLLLIKSYHYFKEKEYQGAPFTKFFSFFNFSSPGEKSYEKEEEEEEKDDDDVALVDALNSLKTLHQRFFHGQCKDVRLLLLPSSIN